MSWKITAYAPRETIHAALVAHEEAFDWDHEVVLSGREIAEDKPDDWVLEAWLDRKPRKADLAMVRSLFNGTAPKLNTEEIEQQDWVTLSQLGVDPISAGCFHVRTPEHPAPEDPGLVDFIIPASQAFGTGQHETTAGCLAMLNTMKQRGVMVRNLADIGTGTGLLAFAALHLWPRALATASDIDSVCADVVEDNAALNHVATGGSPGQLAMTIADGMEDELLQARAPYDLLIANILAGPLVELSQDFADAIVPGGHLLLAGLLETQEATVRQAYRRAGMRLAGRLVNGDWSILWLRKRNLAPSRYARSSGSPRWSR